MLAIVPTLFKPRLLTIKNRWLHSRHGVIKETVALSISLLMMTGIYLCTWAALRQGATLPALSELGITPSAPLGLILSGLLGMLFVTATMCAFSALFMSRDLEIAFCVPISRSQFLLAKSAEVGFSSSWMVSTFALPSLIACGEFFQAGALFYVGAPILFVALFIPLVLTALIAAISLAVVLPANRSQLLFALLSIAAVIFIITKPSAAGISSSTIMLADQRGVLTAISSLTHQHWLPTIFCADAILALTHGTYTPLLYALTTLLLTTLLLWGLLHCVCAVGYHRAFARAHAHHKPYRINSRSAQLLARILFPFARATTRAVATKEFKIFSRDITHTVQLGMLLAICFIYLYTFKALKTPHGLSSDASAVWQTFLLLGNTVLNSFVVISICSRFVFPSVSLEGSGFWIVQSSPLSYGELLRAKCKGWLLPISLISAVIFSSGAMALDADGSLVIASLVSGVIVSYGIVGLAVGLGALFVRFDYEHSTQVSASLGGLLFIFAAIALLVCDLIPLTFMFTGHILFPAIQQSIVVDILEFYAPLVALLVINITATALAIRFGRRALKLL